MHTRVNKKRFKYLMANNQNDGHFQSNEEKFMRHMLCIELSEKIGNLSAVVFEKQKTHGIWVLRKA